MDSRSRARHFVPALALLLSAIVPIASRAESTSEAPGYDALLEAFAKPDHSRWGEVPLWWWEGAPMTRERVTWQLETLAAKGVKSVCPIQRSPGRCLPQSFDADWWEMFAYVNGECRRLGMTLWAYDQVGYGHYGWLEKAAATVRDPEIKRVEFLNADAGSGERVTLDLPAGTLVAARAYPLQDGRADDGGSLDLSGFVEDGKLAWNAPEGRWRVTASVAVPAPAFYLSEASTEAFLDMLYGRIERELGKEAMGASFVGVFQDEHPPTPRDLFSERLAREFRERCGYPIGRAIPALHFDVGPLTPKYRTDFLDSYLTLVEETYWKKVFDWAEERGILTSHDNWGRNNIYRQSEGYIDYFRSQRWFSAPGYDDAGQRPIEKRNYYDAKIASSIARMYGRPRVWNEAFHSSGWGRTTDQTLTWLTTGMTFGANLYDEHGLYYSTNASTWEHAAPDPHWRQPYWVFYQTLSDWVARTSHLMSQGRHVVDAAVHYPATSLLAGEAPGEKGPDYNRYMRLSRSMFDAGIDNDIFDDDSCLSAEVRDGAIHMGGNAYQALVFGPETTIRLSVLEKARQLVEAGGTVIFIGKLPQATVEGGRGDAQLDRILTDLLGTGTGPADGLRSRKSSAGGFCGFLPESLAGRLPALVSQHIERDFVAEQEGIYTTHRQIGDTHVYLVQSIRPEPVRLHARLGVDGVAEIWDAFTGEVRPVEYFARGDGHTVIEHTLKGTTAHLFVIRPGAATSGGSGRPDGPGVTKALADDWEFSVEPTRDNRWGEFRWPPSDTLIGPEVRRFDYRETDGSVERGAEWSRMDESDGDWREVLYSTGPCWLVASVAPDNAPAAADTLQSLPELTPGATTKAGEETLHWQGVEFSKRIGLAKAAPWGGHSGYPDGHIDRSFVRLPEGRKLLFTRLHSQRDQRLGLRIELNNGSARMWVNGAGQPVEDAVGNLPLKQGANTVLLELPDGSGGRLYVQRTPPSVATLEEAAGERPGPDLSKAGWIWAGDGDACHVRRTFVLDAAPDEARLTVSAFSGYRLFVNGVKIGEEVGPWANWKQPETFNITRHLKPGRNVIAIWGQMFAGINVNKGQEGRARRGIVAALRGTTASGETFEWVTDEFWQGSVGEAEGWEQAAFDDSGWAAATVRGRMGDAPWGWDVVRNVDPPTTPQRPLSVNLESPYLACFEEVPEIIHEVKRPDDPRIGWFRFKAPPGLRALDLGQGIEARVWVDGNEAKVEGGIARVSPVPADVSGVVVRVEMPPGTYAGAVFPEPIGLTLGGGRIRPGLWADHALPTYSGLGIYAQEVRFDRNELDRRILLDLGEVRVAAEVRVNGESAGVRLAAPFEFDLTGLVREGRNRIEVRIANTIAPHYATIPALHTGPTDSGLLGPVTLQLQDRRGWARPDEAD